MSGHNTGAVAMGKVTTRGTSNSDVRGSSETRRRRRQWLVDNYRANVDVLVVRREDDGTEFRFEDADVSSCCNLRPRTVVMRTHSQELMPGWLFVAVVPACRCYRCGDLLTADTVTVDRRIPGCQGGRYVQNNIRPACGDCNSETGGRTRSKVRTKLKAVSS